MKKLIAIAAALSGCFFLKAQAPFIRSPMTTNSSTGAPTDGHSPVFNADGSWHYAAAIATNNAILWVDPVLGFAAGEGVRGVRTKPFLSLTNAEGNSLPGDTFILLPGTNHVTNWRPLGNRSYVGSARGTAIIFYHGALGGNSGFTISNANNLKFDTIYFTATNLWDNISVTSALSTNVWFMNSDFNTPVDVFIDTANFSFDWKITGNYFKSRADCIILHHAYVWNNIFDLLNFSANQPSSALRPALASTNYVWDNIFLIATNASQVEYGIRSSAGATTFLGHNVFIGATPARGWAVGGQGTVYHQGGAIETGWLESTLTNVFQGTVQINNNVITVDQINIGITSTAPTSVTVGTTAPDYWESATNSAGVKLMWPVWINH